MIAPYTDTTLPAILASIDHQLLTSDIVTLTRGQIAALLANQKEEPNVR